MKTSCLVLLFVLLIPLQGICAENLIYSVMQDLPMGNDNEIVRKNFYLNMGSNQGLNPGTILDVFRTVSKENPYDNKKRINYRIKIGEIQVLHTEDEASVGIQHTLLNTVKDPLFDINNFMIGDQVTVKIDK